jgi:hypothetical protein
MGFELTRHRMQSPIYENSQAGQDAGFGAGPNARAPCLPIGRFVNTISGEIKAAFCGSWACVRCGPRKVATWCIRIERGRWDWFLTLTLPGDGSPTRENFSRLGDGWANVRQFLKREYAMEDYTWVREQGERKTKRLHLHVLLRSRRIAAGRLRRVALRAGLGTWLHLSAVRSSRSAKRYCSKYLSASAGECMWPKYTRRCQTTIPKAVAQAGWTFEKEPKWHRATWRSNQRYDDALAAAQRVACGILVAAGSDCPDLYLTGYEKVAHSGPVKARGSPWDLWEACVRAQKGGIG